MKSITDISYDNAGNPTSVQPYKFGGKELITSNGLNEYDFGARRYLQAVPHFTSIDPLCEKRPDLSPYLYCGYDPINAIDPDGRSTWVTDIGNGLYEVIGGDLNDDDLNIYLYSKDKDGNYTVRGNSIGQTTSMTSFYDSGEEIGMTGEWMTGSVIDTNDHSGELFFSNLVEENPSLFDNYMINARENGTYDFKNHNNKNPYRGMPFGTTKDGIPIYTSARDIGNISAGYIAAVNGIPWNVCRIGFDGYQSIQKGHNTMEGESSMNAQYYGWTMGKSNTSFSMQMVNFARSFLRAGKYIKNQSVKWLNSH